MRTRPVIHFLFFAGAGLCTITARAEIDLQGLVKNSPFGEGRAPAEKSGALEFRGVYVDQGVTYFNIYSPATKSSTWIAQGENSNGPLNLAVKSYDEVGNTLIVENNGQAVKMKLHEPVILKLEAATPIQAEARNVPALTTASADATSAKDSKKDSKSNVTPEQAQAFREQMRQRWAERQNNDKSSTPNTKAENKKSDSSNQTDNSKNETTKTNLQ